MPKKGAAQQLEMATQHLDRVQTAAWDPIDWTDLSLYGFYCLECAVMAAATHVGWTTKRTHPAKAEAAAKLHQEFGLPDVRDLLWTLNSARKATAYGDVELPELDAEEVSIEVEEYVIAVTALLEKGP